MTRISIHALREEGDNTRLCFEIDDTNFYPRPPRGGRPQIFFSDLPLWSISIHALREEGDRLKYSIGLPSLNFYPRPPRGGRRPRLAFLATAGVISIHALREEGDSIRSHRQRVDAISIHALREEGDPNCRLCAVCRIYFYPRPPRGGRPPTGTPDRLPDDFYPRPPRGGRHVPQQRLGPVQQISIHALREEGDPVNLVTADFKAMDFYPRPPRGGRPSGNGAPEICVQFLSTPSARRATTGPRCRRAAELISIHALREEGDASITRRRRRAKRFLSTPSARRATARLF